MISVGSGSVNYVPKVTSTYSVARLKDSQLRADLTMANNIIAQLQDEQ